MFKKIISDLKEKKENADQEKQSLNKDSQAESVQQKPEEQTQLSTMDFTRVMEEEDTLVLENKKRSEFPASLVMLSGPKDLIGMSWTLEKPLMGVGRSARLNEISISHESLSKSHFQILKEGELFYILDLKSTNKTYLDDSEIEPYKKIPLKNNSYIKASSLIFKFLDKGNIEVFSSQQVLSMAQTDSLTGIGNRQLLQVKGPEYFLDKRRTLSLIVFDVDDFKSINDNLGHLAGDYVLSSLSKVILKLIREGDIFIRYGGDEFCLLTPNSFSVTAIIADRIKQEIANYPFVFKEQKISVDISIGLAERLETDHSWEDIYHRADKMSYERKRKKKSKKTQTV